MTENEIQQAIQVLQRLNRDGAGLEGLSEELRVQLMTEASRLSRPSKLDLKARNREISKARQRRIVAQDKKARASTGIREARRNPVFSAPPLISNSESSNESAKLGRGRSCYVCKREFNTVHFFYDSMCEPCAEFNYRKRFQTASLVGQVALITGA